MGGQTDANKKTLIRNGTIVTAGQNGRILISGNVRIHGDTIVAVETGSQGDASEDYLVLDASGMIVSPGFVDDHRHLWQTPLRGLAADLTGAGYRSEVRGRFGPHYTPEDVYIGTLAGALDALDSGITTIGDFAHVMNGPEFADASLAALESSGMRAVFGYGTPTSSEADAWYSNSSLGHPEDIRRVCKESRSDRVSVMMAARAPYLMSDATTAHDWALARELGIRIHIDGGLGGGMWGGVRHYPVRALFAAGLTGADTTYVHCNNLSEDEYQTISDTGGHVSVSPIAEMNVGHGMPAIPAILRAGMRPSISSDFVTQASSDMFSVMRAAISASRGFEGYTAFHEGRGIDAWKLRSADMLDFATRQGARSLGLDGKVGQIAEGMKADIVLIDATSLRLSPMNDPVATIVMQATPRDVYTVLVGGKIVKEAGQLLHHDVAAVRNRLNECRDRLFSAAGANFSGREQTLGGAVWSW